MKRILFIGTPQDGGDSTPAPAKGKKAKSTEASAPASTEASAPASTEASAPASTEASTPASTGETDKAADDAAPEPVETAEQKLARLEARNAELEAESQSRREADELAAKDEKVIVEKMGHGLTREQAKSVIRRQREFDAREAERRQKVQQFVDELPEGLTGAQVRQAIRSRFTDANSDELKIRRTGSKPTWD